LGRNLYPKLSVFENIDFFGHLFGQNAAERQRRIDELTAVTGPAAFIDLLPEEKRRDQQAATIPPLEHRVKPESKDSFYGLDVIHLCWRRIMGKAHLGDLRERVEARIAAGYSRRDTARHFGVSASFATKLA
jgi:hypothetical protein